MKKSLVLVLFIILVGQASSQVCYITPEGSGTMDGSSWNNALNGNGSGAGGYTRFAEVLSTALPGSAFWVAEGTYRVCTDNDREKSFELKQNIQLYGGFEGVETSIVQRNTALHLTVLSGDIGQQPDSTDNTKILLKTVSTPWTIVSRVDGFIFNQAFNNQSNAQGAGIINTGILEIINCEFRNCYANGAGAGICNLKTITIDHSLFFNNRAGFEGGGFYNHYTTGNATVTASKFSNNKAYYRGGGISNCGVSVIINTLIVNNQSLIGGGVSGYSHNNYPAVNTKICNSTLANNSGFDLYIDHGKITLLNSILWGSPISLSSSPVTDIRYSNVQGYTGHPTVINAEPLFVSPTAGTGTGYNGLSGNWSLRWCSPSFEAGADSLIPAGITTDLNGNPRIRYSAVDHGAYETDTTGVIRIVVEFTNNRIYVIDSIPYPGNGSTWENAVPGNAESCKYPGYSLLYETMKDAIAGTQIWIKKGEYKSATNGNRSHSFTLNDGVLVYGGFEGNESEITQRINGVTQFTGDIGVTGDSVDNVRHVLKINPENIAFTDTALLDRIEICRGLADSSGEDANGAGIWLGSGTKLRLNACTVVYNTAKAAGSGIFTKSGTWLEINQSAVSINTQKLTQSGSSSFYGSPGCGVYNQGKLVVRESQFKHNRNASEGIAIYNADSLWIYNCILDSNSSMATNTRGGALSNAKFTLLHGCSLQYNTAVILGGAIWNKSTGNMEMDSSHVSYNQCNSANMGSGGGLYNDGQLILNHITLSHNQSKLDGGGLFNSSSGTAILDRCTVSFNNASGGTSATAGGGGIYNGGILHVNRTKICNNSTDKNGGGIYNPTVLRNSLVANNSRGGTLKTGGGLSLNSGCQGIFNSTIVNNSGEAVAAAYGYGTNIYLLPDTFEIHNSILYGNQSSLLGHYHVTHSTVQDGYSGNSNSENDPLFLSPSQGVGIPFNGIEADWSLTQCSPCINTASSEYLTLADSLDIADSSRIFGPQPDMGAYEYQAAPVINVSFSSGILFVTESNTQSGMGTSWSDTLSGNAPSCKYPGFTMLYEALHDIPDSCDMWIKKGTYYPSFDSIRTRSFIVKSGTRILGGFTGSETSEEERDPLQNATCFSGDIGLKNDSTDNSYNIVTCKFTTNHFNDSTVFSGFSFKNGNADGTNSKSQAGCIRNEASNYLYIENCTFSESYALNGASIYNNGFLRVNNSVFRKNRALNSPGIYNNDTAFIQNCTMSDNIGFGALTNSTNSYMMAENILIDSGFVENQNYIQYNCSGIMNSGELMFKNSVIQNQSGTTFEGGAIKNSGNLTIDSCHFSNNITQMNPSCIKNTNSAFISNSTFNNNYSVRGTIQNSGNMEIHYCSINHNLGGLMGPGFAYFGKPGGISNNGNMIINHTGLCNNFAAGGGGALLNTGDVEITNSLFQDNLSGSVTPSGGGMFQIYVVSTGFNGGAIKNSGNCLIDRCTFYKNKACHGAAISHISGNLTINNARFLENYCLMEGAVLLNQGILNMNNSLISNNHSEAHLGFGSVFSNGLGSKLNINNSTLANNYSANQNFINTGVDLFGSGNGLVINYGYPIADSIKIFNSIVNGNSSVFVNNTNQSFVETTYCCFDTTISGVGNLNADPLFVDPTTFIGFSTDTTFNILNTDWTLSACSPCIDAGNDTLVADTIDLAGNERIYNHVDMGAYELPYLDGLYNPKASAIGRYQAVLSWKNHIKPCRTAVFLKDTCCGVPVPLNAGIYLPDTNYAIGSNLDGWSCVFNGTGDSVSVVGLDSGTTYRAAIFNYLLGQFYDTSVTCNFTTEYIQFNDILKSYGDAPFIPLPLAASGIHHFTFSSPDTLVAVIDGDTLQIAGAGIAMITAVHSGDSLYLPDSATAQLTVDQAPLLCILQDKQRGYGQPNPLLTYQLNGFVNGEDSTVLDVLPVAVCQATPVSPVGQYPISASGGFDNNYLFSYQEGVLTITPALLEATANDTSRLYGDPNPPLSYEITGFMNGEDISVIDTLPQISTTANSTSPVGNYPLNVCCATDNNYTFQYVNGILSVTKSPLEVWPNDTTRLYGSPNPSFTALITGFKNNENASVIDTLPVLSSPALVTSSTGNYPINSCCAGDDNYSFVYYIGTLTITKAPLQVFPSDTLREYGEPNPQFHLTYAGFVNGEDPSVLTTEPIADCEADILSPVGFYDIVSCCGEDENYELIYHIGTLEIYPAILGVTAADTFRVVGEQNPWFRLIYDGFKNGEDTVVLTVVPVGSSPADTLSPPGQYPIFIEGGIAQNYTFQYTEGTLTVLLNTGIPQQDILSGIIAYPNPFSSMLFIKLSYPEIMHNISIFDVSGHHFFETTTENINPVSLSLEKLSAGVYFLRITSSNTTTFIRVVKIQ